MTPGSTHDAYGEAGLEGDSIQIGEVLAILARNKLLIAITTVLVAAATVVWVGTRTPRYRARATLLLEQDEAAGGVLSEIAALSSNPAGDTEIALIETRSLAVVTAAAPSEWKPPSDVFTPTEPDFDPFAHASGAGGDPSAMESLGLMWLAERHDLRPSRGMLRRLTGAELPSHRLYARIEPADEEAPHVVDVTFLPDEGQGARVRIAREAGLFGGGGDPEVFDYTPGMEVDYHGTRIALKAAGDFAGQSYRLERLVKDQAVNHLMEDLEAAESGRKTNVVHVRVRDSDPNRAAEVANAICKNYIRRSVRIGQQKATRTMRFIDAQLDDQLEALAAAERRVVELQTANPETIAMSTTAMALVEQLTSLGLERTRSDLSLTVIGEALELLDQGDHEALARLGQEVPNLLALSYIRELAQLQSESLRLDRSDVLGYKALLTEERQRLRRIQERHDLLIGQLESALVTLRAGDTSAIARLEAAGVSNSLRGYSTEIARLDGELGRLRGSSTEQNPLVRSLESAREELIRSVTAQVANALDGAKEARDGYVGLIDSYTASIAEYPASERGTIDDAVGRLRARIRTSLDAQAAGLEARLSAIDEQTARIETRLGELPESELTLAEPLRQRETRAKIVEFLLSSQQEAAITAAATSAAAVLIDPAVPPTIRTYPRAKLFIAIGALFGVAAGCGLAFLRNVMRGALFTEADVERYSGLSVLGAVPDYLRGRTRIKGAGKQARFLPLRDDPEGPQAEAYRQIRASLHLAMRGEDALRTLAVTSCVPSEGKTVTNASLATVFAGAGRRVLLVDCDLRKPQVHNLYDLPREPGMGNVLEENADWRGCVHHTDHENLDVLPAGRCKARPGELLAGERALPVIDELVAEYDLVVFDLPPAVLVADVANFATKLDAILLLYRSGGVPGRLLANAANRLRQAGVHLMGVILNAVYVGRGVGGYGYGYGYGYAERDEAESRD